MTSSSSKSVAIERVRLAVDSVIGASARLQAEISGRLSIQVSGALPVGVAPQLSPRTLASLARSEAFAAHLAQLREAQDRAVKAIGDVGDAAVVRHQGGAPRWMLILPDVSDPTGHGWRLQRFDLDGFSGHECYRSKDEALGAAASQDFTVRDDDALDRLQGTSRFQRGLFAADLLMQVNMGSITLAQADIRLSEYDQRSQALASVIERGAQAFVVPESGEVILVADRIAPGTEVAVYLHEMTHRWGRRMLDQEVWARLVTRLRAWGGRDARSLERKIFEAARQRVLSARVAPRNYDEELFAYAVEEAVQAGVKPSALSHPEDAPAWLEQVVQDLRIAFLRQAGADGPSSLPELDLQTMVNLAYAMAQLDSPDRLRRVWDVLGAEERQHLQDLMNRGGMPMWYSRLAMCLEITPQQTLYPSAWRRRLRQLVESDRVDQREVDWSGISEWLSLQGERPVDRLELVDFARGNGLRVSEQQLTAGVMVLRDGQIDRLVTSGEAAKTYIDHLCLTHLQAHRDKGWAEDQLQAAWDSEVARYRADSQGTTLSRTSPTGSGYRELVLTMQGVDCGPLPEHWDDLEDVVAVVRVSDRAELAAERVLVVEGVALGPVVDGPEGPARQMVAKRLIKLAADGGYQGMDLAAVPLMLGDFDAALLGLNAAQKVEAAQVSIGESVRRLATFGLPLLSVVAEPLPTTESAATREPPRLTIAQSPTVAWEGVFSPLRRRVLSAPIDRAPAAEWVRWIAAQTRAGISPEEIAWSGIMDWLERAEGRVSRRQVLGRLDADGLRVRETVYRERPGDLVRDQDVNALIVEAHSMGWVLDRDVFDDTTLSPRSIQFTQRGYRRYWDAREGCFYDSGEEPVDAPSRMLEIARELQEAAEATVDDDQAVRYRRWTLPGGENYREVLLAIPSARARYEAAAAAVAEKYGSTLRAATPIALLKAGASEAEIDTFWSWHSSLEGGWREFKSVHWSVPNVVAHLRLIDRYDEQGRRVLFVEEIQSDWAEEGRQKGFHGRDVPPGPFVSSTQRWVALAIKRVISMAVSEGYGRVAFVGGIQSADRYGLRVQVSRVQWGPAWWGTSDASRLVTLAGRRDGREIDVELIVDLDGVIKESTVLGGLAGKSLGDVLGQELAQAVLQTPSGAQETRLRLGGDGMVAFYDEIVPNVLKKVLRPFGVQAVPMAMDITDFGARGRPANWKSSYGVFEQQLSFDITQEMRDSVQAGMPLFSMPADASRPVATKAFDFSAPADGNALREVRVGDTRVVLDIRPTGDVHLASLRTPQRKRGRGSARLAMQALVTQADEEGVRLVLGASSLDHRTSTPRLIAFYRSLGFVETGVRINAAGDPEMTRAPLAAPRESFDPDGPDALMSVPKPVIVEITSRDTATARVGSRIVGKAFAWEDSRGEFVIMNVEVREQYRRRGVATAMYRAIEEAAGRLLKPAVSLSDDGFEFWKRYRPEAVALDLRHWKDRLLGARVIKGGNPGRIIKASGGTATMEYDVPTERGSQSTILRRDLNALLAAGGSDPIDFEAGVRAPDMAPVNVALSPFDAVFEGSQMVGADGRPLLVFHGTQADFTQFDPSLGIGGGSWFTGSAQAAGEWAMLDLGGGGRVIPVHLLIRNPLRLSWRDAEPAAAARRAKRAGHDGLIYEGEDGETSYVVFSAGQVLSAFMPGAALGPKHDPHAEQISVAESLHLRWPGAAVEPLPMALAEVAPVGAWIDLGFPDLRGRPIAQVRTVPVNSLYKPELDERQELQPEKRSYVPRYVDLLKAGHSAPRVHAVEMEDGRLRLTDGHRRVTAASLAGDGFVQALVAPLIEVPGEGAVPLTAELALRYPDQVQSASVGAWFGDAASVDSRGQPLIGYHGTDALVTTDALVPGPVGNMGPGIYFAGTRDEAQTYGEHVHAAFLRMRNPWRIELENDSASSFSEDFDSPSIDAVLSLPGGRELLEKAKSGTGMYGEELQELLKSMGFDGVIGTHSDGSCEYVVFGADQLLPVAAANARDSDAWGPGMPGLVCGPSGKPLVLYRGEHGGVADVAAGWQTALGSVTFTDSPELASLYAMEPNDSRMLAQQPRVLPVFATVREPVFDTRDDPFVDFGLIAQRLGRRAALHFAVKHSQAIEATGLWVENEDGVASREQGGHRYESVPAMLKEHPLRLDSLYIEAYRLLDDPEFVLLARAAGCDGAIYAGFGDSVEGQPPFEVRVFSANQVVGRYEPAARSIVEALEEDLAEVLMSVPAQPVRRHADGSVFYSELLQRAQAVAMRTGTPQSWLSWLAGLHRKGVSPDEIAWSGVREWLGSQHGSVDKARLLKYLQAHVVQVNDVILSSEGDPMSRVRAAVFGDLSEDEARMVPGHQLGQPTDFVVYVDGRANGVYEAPTAQDAIQEVIEGLIEADSGLVGDARYADHTLPGGKNYREILLTLPERRGGAPAAYHAFNAAMKAKYGERVNLDMTKDEQAQARALRDAADGEKLPSFRSNHWDAHPNVLVHIRVTDRISTADGFVVRNRRSGHHGPARGSLAEAQADLKRYPVGIRSNLEVVPQQRVLKTLLVEEIQSDWGQNGKREGFDTHEKVARRAELLSEQDLLRSESIELQRNGYSAMSLEQNQRLATINARLGVIGSEMPVLSKIPAAPFVTSTEKWVSLAIKRVMKMAVDGGYDRVAFATGEQNATRFSLRKWYSSIEVRPLKDGTDKLVVYGDGQLLQHCRPEGLAKVVGKDLARRALEDGAAHETVRYSGRELAVGGEGLMAFYDQVVPVVARDLLKKAGGGQLVPVDVGGRVDASDHNETPVEWFAQPGFDVTPGLIDAIAGGVPLFGAPMPATPRTTVAVDGVASVLLSRPADGSSGTLSSDALMATPSGRPRVFFHGTRPGVVIEKFELNSEHDGIYFTPDPGYAEGFTIPLEPGPVDEAGAIYPVHLDVRNPYVVRAHEESDAWESFVYRGLDRIELIAQGFDGAVLVHEPTGEIDQVMVFYPEQVRSVFEARDGARQKEAMRRRRDSDLEGYSASRTPEFVYHVTPSRNLASILLQGVIPMIGPRSQLGREATEACYFFPTVEAVSYALENWMGDVFDDDDRLSVLAVAVDAKAGWEFDAASGEVRCTRRVPADQIQLAVADDTLVDAVTLQRHCLDAARRLDLKRQGPVEIEGEANAVMASFAGVRSRLASLDGNRWFRGVDGRQRYEIDDSQAMVNVKRLLALKNGSIEPFQVKSVVYRRNDSGTYSVLLLPPREQLLDLRDIRELLDMPSDVVTALLPPALMVMMDSGQGEDDYIGDFEEARRVSCDFEFGRFNALPLDMVLDHPALFLAYPQLRKIMVRVDPSMECEAALERFVSRQDDGRSVDQMVITLRHVSQYSGRTTLGQILHEVQHQIQRIEGFPDGGNVENVSSQVRAWREQLWKRIADFGCEFPGTVQAFTQLHAQIADVAGGVEGLKDDPGSLDWLLQVRRSMTSEQAARREALEREYAVAMERELSGESVGRWADLVHASSGLLHSGGVEAVRLYWRLAGETEARAVQHRQSLNDAERASTPVWKSWDVEEDAQLCPRGC